jgi:CarD family transcriptional regulator
MYAVGDKVVHPGYGPGVIRDVERRQVIGEAKRYYVIDLQAGGGTLMTPVAGADDVGLRPAISPTEVKRLLNSLTNMPSTLSEDFKERQTEIEEQLKAGDVFVTARVYRDLSWYGRNHGLTKRDTQLLQRAEELVAAELALIGDTEVTVAAGQMQQALEESMQDPGTE